MFAYLRRMEFDDGISVPLHYLAPDPAVRLGPITMNCTVPPVPTTEAAYRLGQVLQALLTEHWPGPERIAVVATGGLSHEPGGPRYLRVDETIDRWFLDLLAEGDHTRIVRECTVARMEAAGSGGHRRAAGVDRRPAVHRRSRRGARLRADGGVAHRDRHGRLADPRVIAARGGWRTGA